VHDSFATHACDIDKLNESIREAFVSIFSKDLLSDFKAKVSETLSDEAIAELPDRPKDGELDLDLLHKCKYFFA
jgi:DNA-directed RNA polymerase